MPDSKQKHPLQLLYEIEQRSIKLAKGLPQRVDVTSTWTGIGFRIGEYKLVAPLQQVNEILHYPRLTMVPGTQAWFKGVANVRGTLLTIMDLQSYLGQEASVLRPQSRVLVVKRDDLAVGLIVDEIYGLRHFSDSEKITAVSKFNESFRHYIQGAFLQNDQETLVFNLYALVEQPEFYQVAV